MARERGERLRRLSVGEWSQADLKRMATGDHSLPEGTIARVSLVCGVGPEGARRSFPVLSEAWRAPHPIRVGMGGISKVDDTTTAIIFHPGSGGVEAANSLMRGETTHTPDYDTAQVYADEEVARLSRELVASHPDLAEAAAAQGVDPVTIIDLKFTAFIRGAYEVIEKLDNRYHF